MEMYANDRLYYAVMVENVHNTKSISQESTFSSLYNTAMYKMKPTWLPYKRRVDNL